MGIAGRGAIGGAAAVAALVVLLTVVSLSGSATTVAGANGTGPAADAGDGDIDDGAGVASARTNESGTGTAGTAGTGATPGPVADSADGVPAVSSGGQRNDTAVLWRGFRHAWSYNHRLSRLGSWVDASCRMERPGPRTAPANCEYTVGHSAAAGSGADDASFRDAYTELSGEGVGFRHGVETVRLEGKEKKPGPKDQTIRGSKEVTIRLGDDLKNYEEYTVLLNGFDTHTESPPAAKVIDFEIGVSDPKTVTATELTFEVRYEVLMDCDSAECKASIGGPGKGVQDIDYPLEIRYLVVGGNESSLNVESGAVNDAYRWEACKGAAHFNCGDSADRELDYRDHVQDERIRTKDGYSVNTVGFKSFSINLDSEAHFAELDMIVGGSDWASYEARAIPFFKEWSSAHSPSTSYGHKGRAEVSAELRVVQIEHGCKRSFVQGGGIRWETSHTNQRSPTDPSAVVEAPEGRNGYEFEFGDHWRGYTDRGSRCTYDEPGLIEPSRDEAYEVNPWRDRDHSAEVVAEEPTRLRLRSSDRFYHDGSDQGTKRWTDMSDVTVTFEPPRGSGPVALFGSGMSRDEGGLYPGEVDIHASAAPGSNVEIERQLVQKVKTDDGGSGWTIPFSDGETTRLTGRYRVLLVVDTPGDGAAPSRAVVPFRIVESPNVIRERVQWYRLRGSERLVDYRYDTDANAWNRSVYAPATQRHGYGVEDHVFVERVAPEMELRHPPSASLDSHITVDGEAVESGENVTEYGTHALAAYVCYNPAADGCDRATVPASTSRSGSTRTRSGPTKGKSKGSNGADRATAVHPGMLVVAEQNVTIVPSVGTLRRVASQVGTVPSWLLGDGRVRLLIVEDDEELAAYYATIDDGEITAVTGTSEERPTLDVLVDPRTMERIANADDPETAAQRAYEHGDIELRSNDPLEGFKFGLVRFVTDVYRFVSTLAGVVLPLAGRTVGRAVRSVGTNG